MQGAFIEFYYFLGGWTTFYSRNKNRNLVPCLSIQIKFNTLCTDPTFLSSHLDFFLQPINPFRSKNKSERKSMIFHSYPFSFGLIFEGI